VIIRLANGDDHWSVQGLARALALTEGPAAAELPSTLKVFVAELDNHIIGFAAIDKVAAQITHLYVTGAARRSGVGANLLRAIVQDVQPGTELGVLVSPTNVPALALYKRIGFEPDVVGEYAGHSQYLSLVLKTTA
jgi:ribosomal protein S18 acetylase RimI-like enzyme